MMCVNILALLGYLAVVNGDMPMIGVGLGNVKNMTEDAPVTIETGIVPTWLSGNFIRHACAAFGETEHMNPSEHNYVDHLFDCIEMGTRFRLDNGHVTFSNKWYDTANNDIFNFYDRDMNKSSVFFEGAFNSINVTQFDKWAAIRAASSKPEGVPHVSWWQIGNNAIGMSEGPIGVIVDPNEVVHKGNIHYKDNNFGFDKSTILANNPAHEQTEPDGTLWSAVALISFTSQTTANISRMVYKVGEDMMRHPIGTFNYGEMDITRCPSSGPYPDMNARFGYLHSFGMTNKYVILPEASYMGDPCGYLHYDVHKPFFTNIFTDESSTGGFGRLLVMRKSDGKFIANLKTPAFFNTHQLGAYEEGELIHMDLLTYPNADIYTVYVKVDAFFKDNMYVTNVTRVTINTTDWTYSFRDLRRGKKGEPFEMSNINYAYYGKKYTHAYMVRNFDRQAQNAITKLNVDTGMELEYVFPVGMYVQEPQFIPTPGAIFEDDGVIMAQGIDGRKKKGFMVILNATDMTLISHITAPGLATFGIHERFFPLHVGKPDSPMGPIIG